jgi:hypothetical protein
VFNKRLLALINFFGELTSQRRNPDLLVLSKPRNAQGVCEGEKRGEGGKVTDRRKVIVGSVAALDTKFRFNP